jgi:outer membrane protein TolC
MVRSFERMSRWTGAVSLLLVAGCQTYEAQPLDPALILQTVDAQRHVESPGESVELARAVRLAEEHSPALRVAAAVDEAARSVAEIPIPLPNPSLSLGPTYLADSDIIGGKKWGFEAAGGWLLDLAGLRNASNDLRHVEALALHVDAVATQRETYLAIRRAFTHLSAARRRRAELAKVEVTSQASLNVAHRLVEAAQATALDTYELDVEARRASADTLEARESEDDARAALSSLIGVEATAFEDVEVPSVPTEAPERGAAVALIVTSHPELDRLRAEYDVAESRLQREILAQYPGLDLGPGFEREEDVDKRTLFGGVR